MWRPSGFDSSTVTATLSAGSSSVDDRQPDDARLGRAIGTAHRLVDESDQRRALPLVGQHRGQKLLRLAEPVAVRSAALEDAQCLGQVAEHAEVLGREGALT